VLVGLLVFVVLPAVASPLLTQIVRDMGIEADDLEVSVESFDASLLTGRTDRLRIRGSNVAVPPALAGRLDLTFGGLSFLNRTFATVSGELQDVSLRAGGLALTISSVRVEGPAGAANATARLTAAEAEELIVLAARRAGVSVDSVRIDDGRLVIRAAGAESRAGIAVQGGALVIERQGAQPVLLLQPAPTDPWQLTDAWVGTDGINIRGIVDAARVAQRLPATGGS
jgi:hypothetical protein